MVHEVVLVCAVAYCVLPKRVVQVGVVEGCAGRIEEGLVDAFSEVMLLWLMGVVWW